jgi:hypothetical protein
MKPGVLAVHAVFVAMSCGQNSGLTPEVRSDPDSRVACGSLEGPEKPCCPASWKAGERCEPGPAAEGNTGACWTACRPMAAAEDGTAHMRGSLSCGADGIIVAGQGLYPCTPGP